MLVVIRCPKCRAASRVDEADLGETVLCPRCADTFAAVEEAELVAAVPAAAHAGDELRTRDGHPPPESLFDSPPRPAREPEPRPPEADADAQFDPHAEPQAALPASVVVGLALLPFLIPILWLLAPIVLGVEPVLSLASALALAFSASVLCLAVIYTVDWRPGTRVKGVLLLIVLSYVTGVGLYFLKKEWVDRVRKFFGVNPTWSVFQVPQGGYQVLMPPARREFPRNEPPPTTLARLACHQATQKSAGVAGEDVFTVGSGEVRRPANANDPAPGTDAWFDKLTADVADRAGGTATAVKRESRDGVPGRQFEVAIGNEGVTRVVEVYYLAGKNRLYYAAVEGRDVRADDVVTVRRFLDSFRITDAAK